MTRHGLNPRPSGQGARQDPREHADIAKAMALAADLAAVDAAYEVMRERGLKPLADQEPR
jgi:hypothetical protein